jgi:hypothetical protein
VSRPQTKFLIQSHPAGGALELATGHRICELPDSSHTSRLLTYAPRRSSAPPKPVGISLLFNISTSAAR